MQRLQQQHRIPPPALDFVEFAIEDGTAFAQEFFGGTRLESGVRTFQQPQAKTGWREQLLWGQGGGTSGLTRRSEVDGKIVHIKALIFGGFPNRMTSKLDLVPQEEVSQIQFLSS
ncbi:MAG: hypothetical protein ACE5I5_02620 [Candidatus Heimdallarchaeota archaeon]